MPDPYAPPPRHKDSSGAIMRYAIMAAFLGLGVWGYMEFANSPAPQTLATEQTTTLADSSMDQGYAVTPTPGVTAPAPAPTEPAPAPRSSAPAQQPAEPVPPPSTTIGTPG